MKANKKEINKYRHIDFDKYENKVDYYCDKCNKPIPSGRTYRKNQGLCLHCILEIN